MYKINTRNICGMRRLGCTNEFSTYCYAIGNDLISFTVRNNETKTTLTHINFELDISKPTTTSVWVRKI